MGLIYIPNDANQVETQLTNNLQMSRALLNRLKSATTHLTTVVGGGKLDGRAYKKGLGLMQDCVLPTIQHAASAIDGIAQDLAAFTSAKSYMPREPLYEDKLTAQIAELKAQKAAQSALSAVYQHHILSLVAGPVGLAIDLAISQFTNAKQQLDNWGNSVDEEIRKTQEKLDKLHQFNAQTSHLFQDSLSKLKLAMQGVEALNGSKINSDGSYRLASGMDKSWFSKVQNVKKRKPTRENNISVDTDLSDLDLGVKARAGKASVGDSRNGMSVTAMEVEGSAGITLGRKTKKKKGQDKTLSSGVGGEVSVGVTAAEAEGHAQLGDDKTNIHSAVRGSSYSAAAHANAGIGEFTNENGEPEYGWQAEAGVSAYAVEGEAKAGFSLFGVKIDVSGSAGVGVAATAKVGVTTEKAEAKLKLGPFGLGLSIDASGIFK